MHRTGDWTIVKGMAVGVLGGLALLAGASLPLVAFGSPDLAPQQPAEVRGRYVLVAGPHGALVRLDTATGRTWMLRSSGEAAPAAGPRWLPIAASE